VVLPVPPDVGPSRRGPRAGCRRAEAGRAGRGNDGAAAGREDPRAGGQAL